MEITQSKTHGLPRMLGVRETAREYGLSEYYVRSLLRSRQIKGVRVGRGKLLCNCQDLERFLSESYVDSSAECEEESY